MLSGKLGYFRASSAIDPDAEAYLLRVEAEDGQPLEPAVRAAVSKFVSGLKSDGLWGAIGVSAILMGARTLGGALEPLVGAACTNNSFVAGDYDRKTGLAGNGVSKSLDLNRNTLDDPIDDYSIGSYVSVMTSAGQTDPALFGTNNTSMQVRTTNTHLFTNRSTASAAGTLAAGFHGMSRASASSYFRITGNLTTPQSVATAANAAFYVSQPTYLYRVHSGSPLRHSAVRQSFYWAGRAVSLGLMRARVLALVADIGAAIP